VLVVATDLPGLTVGLLRFLAGHPAQGCVVPLDVAGHPQLLCARYPSFALARAAGLVEQGRRAVGALLDGEDVTWLTVQDWLAAAGSPAALADVDTPADLARLSGYQGARP
jgi:molybdopterin-guanine dinucleotide biosynthesis protein A